MKKFTKFVFTTAAAAVGMNAYNKFVDKTATSKHLLKTDKGHYYDWKEGRIYYSTIGDGQPLLLIHDINATASAKEWTNIRRLLAKNHMVYTIDLPGCGRSDKPAIQYTAYLYVQAISSFITDVIGFSTDVVASNASASIVLLANQLNESIFNHIILINPVDISKTKKTVNDFTKLQQYFFALPLVGTFFYNVFSGTRFIDASFRQKGYAKQAKITSRVEDSYYEAAHLGGGKGRYLFGSIASNYTNIDVTHVVKALDKPVLIIAGDALNHSSVIETYQQLNPNFEVRHVADGKLYPQLEVPEKITSIVDNYTEE